MTKRFLTARGIVTAVLVIILLLCLAFGAGFALPSAVYADDAGAAERAEGEEIDGIERDDGDLNGDADGEEEIYLDSVSIAEWEWNAFDYLLNVITVETNADAENVFYTVYADNGGQQGNTVVNLSGFRTNAYGVIQDDVVRDALNKLGAGKYWLTASVSRTGAESLTVSVRFTVKEYGNDWQKEPDVIEWTWREFDAKINRITAKAQKNDSGKVYFGVYTDKQTAYSEVLSKFEVNDDGIVSEIIEKELKALDAGDYLLKCWTENANANYSDLSDFLAFTVHKIQNYWVEVPALLGWSEGSFDAKENLFNGKATVGNIKYTVYDSKDKVLYTLLKDANGNIYYVSDAEGNSVHISLLNNLSAGKYKLLAEVEGSDNYTALSNSVLFEISDDAIAVNVIIGVTVTFAVIDVIFAGVCITLLIIRRRKVEKQFRNMINKELHRR